MGSPTANPKAKNNVDNSNMTQNIYSTVRY